MNGWWSKTSSFTKAGPVLILRPGREPEVRRAYTYSEFRKIVAGGRAPLQAQGKWLTDEDMVEQEAAVG